MPLGRWMDKETVVPSDGAAVFSAQKKWAPKPRGHGKLRCTWLRERYLVMLMLWETGTNTNLCGSRGLGGGEGKLGKERIFMRLHGKLQGWTCVCAQWWRLPKWSPPRPRPDLNVASDSTEHMFVTCDKGTSVSGCWSWRSLQGVSVASTGKSVCLLLSSAVTLEPSWQH